MRGRFWLAMVGATLLASLTMVAPWEGKAQEADSVCSFSPSTITDHKGYSAFGSLSCSISMSHLYVDATVFDHGDADIVAYDINNYSANCYGCNVQASQSEWFGPNPYDDYHERFRITEATPAGYHFTYYPKVCYADATNAQGQPTEIGCTYDYYVNFGSGGANLVLNPLNGLVSGIAY